MLLKNGFVLRNLCLVVLLRRKFRNTSVCQFVKGFYLDEKLLQNMNITGFRDFGLFGIVQWRLTWCARVIR